MMTLQKARRLFLQYWAHTAAREASFTEPTVRHVDVKFFLLRVLSFQMLVPRVIVK